MSRGDWLKHPKARLIGGLLAALTFCSAWIGYGLSESADYERQARANSHEYSRYTRDKVTEACVGIPLLERIKCLQEAEDAESEYGYNQNDLVAQRQSALWAYIMAAAAVIGMALSAVGVWLVKTTFDETRRANEIARESMVAQNRAWLSVNAAIDSPLIIDPNAPELRITIVLTIHNHGGAPATNVDISAELTLGMHFELSAKQREVAKRPLETNEGGWFPNITMVPGQSFPQRWSLVTSGGAVDVRRVRAKEVGSDVTLLPVGVVGCVQYRLPGSPVLHQTGFAYQIELIPTPTRGQVIFESDLPVEQNRLRLSIPIGGTGLVD